MVRLRRLSLVTVTLCAALVEPTGTVPKLIDDGDTLTLVRAACAAVVQASNIAIAAAIP